MSVASALVENSRARFKRLLGNGFVRNVGILAGGTAFAQALTILVLPLLTRLYTPEHFSILAVYASMLGIVAVAACLRLEIAIPIPERDEDAANLLALALCSAAAFAVLSGVIILVFRSQIIGLVHQPALRPYLWLLPLGILLTGVYSGLQYWATRRHKFSLIARTRLTQALGGASAQVGLGFLGIAPFGLLLGQVINSGAGVFGLARDTFRNDHHALRAVSLARMRRMFGEYSRFPKYSTFEALANTAGNQLPVIVIAALAIGPEAGYLMLASRAMAAPMTLIGRSVAQVYLARAPEEMRNGNLAEFTIRILGGLAKIGIGPLVFAGIVSPIIFPIVFGKQWLRAGEIVFWMVPWFVFQFLSSPVSMVMHIRNRQKAMLVLTVFGLIIRLSALYLAADYARGYFSEFYALSGGVFYFICICVFLHVAGVRFNDVVLISKKIALTLAAWVFAGVLIKLASGSLFS